MSVNLVIKAQPGSSAFLQRTIIVEPGGRVAVSRGSKDSRPRSDNAIFDCRVRRESVGWLEVGNVTKLIIRDIGIIGSIKHNCSGD